MGGAVTLFSMIVSYVLLGILETPLYITYVSVYFVSILLSYYLNVKFVFKARNHYTKLIQYAGVYISGMIIGMLCLKILEINLSLENWILAFMVIPITLIWNFTFSYLILQERSPNV